MRRDCQRADGWQGDWPLEIEAIMLGRRFGSDAREETTEAQGTPPRHEPERHEIEAQLFRLLETVDFRKSRAASQFLKYVVDESLNGRAERLKGYTIATVALGRSRDFDPQISSAVRVQAKRVRSLLHNYYLAPGTQDRVYIELPLGQYQPVFRYLDCPFPNHEKSPVGGAASGTKQCSGPHWLVAIVILLIVISMIAVAFGLGEVRSSPPRSPDGGQRPPVHGLPGRGMRATTWLDLKVAVHPHIGAGRIWSAATLPVTLKPEGD